MLEIETENTKKSDGRFKLYTPGIILSVVAVITIGAISLAIILRGQGRDIFSGREMEVYFFNSSEGRLVAESRPWPHGNQLDWVETAISHLRFPPNSRNLASTWPAINPLLGVEETPFLQNVSIHNDEGIATARLQFYDSYLEMPPLQEALFRSAITLTLTNLTFIDQVTIEIGENSFTETADTIANNPTVSAARLGNTRVILYQVNDNGDGLVRRYYQAQEVDTGQMARFALEMLIDSSQAGIPTETRINAVIPVTETNSVYVNLSSEFLTRFTGGPAQASLTTSAIVNTVLRNSPGARQVFFLIDSAREEHVHGIGDFSGGFEYDDTYLAQWIVPNGGF